MIDIIVENKDNIMSMSVVSISGPQPIEPTPLGRFFRSTNRSEDVTGVILSFLERPDRQALGFTLATHARQKAFNAHEINVAKNSPSYGLRTHQLYSSHILGERPSEDKPFSENIELTLTLFEEHDIVDTFSLMKDDQRISRFPNAYEIDLTWYQPRPCFNSRFLQFTPHLHKLSLTYFGDNTSLSIDSLPSSLRTLITSLPISEESTNELVALVAKNCPRLDHLAMLCSPLSNIAIASIAKLSELHTLRIVSEKSKESVSYLPLARLPHLRDVEIEDCQNQNIDDISNSKSIKRLALLVRGYVDLTPLFKLTSLRHLVLVGDHHILDCSENIVAGCRSLQILERGGNIIDAAELRARSQPPSQPK